MLHAYRLVYPDSPHAPEILWEWEEPHIRLLFKNAGTFRRQVVQCSFAAWDALAQENQRIWETRYLPWDTWQSWLDEYREIVRDMQDIYEEHSGRMNADRLRARQQGQ